jgi:MFS family permease
MGDEVTVDTSGSEAAKAPKSPKVKIPFGANYWKLFTASVVSNLGDGIAQIAYPWLASAVTRDPVLIALIAVAQRLPWLVFSLPAGVLTDRLDRKKIMQWTSVFRTVLTAVVAVIVLMQTDVLPAPGELVDGADLPTNTLVYTTLLVAALLFGFAEVLFDNSAQTIMPAVVKPEALERANGRLWGAEMVMNSFVGPPMGSVLIGIGFALPFFFDMGTFAVASVMIFLMSGVFTASAGRAKQANGEKVKRAKGSFWNEIKEGFSWLWRHPLLRPMAIILGLMNALGSVTGATFILFAQEVLGVDAFTFAILGMAGAVGGIIGSLVAARVSQKLGSGTSLYITLLGGAVITLLIGLSSNWVVVGILFAGFTLTAVLWNVITVSLRQTIIPDQLLGRVNSVYRFFAWGMIPIGLGIGGLMVAVAESLGMSRTMALRLPYFVVAVASFIMFLWAAPQLTTEKIESARSEGIASKAAGAGEQPTSDAD